MTKNTKTIQVHKKLRLRKRDESSNWQACLTIQGGKRLRRSTNTDDLEEAKEAALEIYYDVKARLENKLPAQTRKFKHVADFAIKRMESELTEGTGKQAYKDYASALRQWLIPFFGKMDVASIDLAALKSFEAWRTEKHSKPFSKSGINNHNAALNRVFDEAELHGWMVKSMRPTLLNKGTESVSRGSFTPEEYKQLYTALRTWHKKTDNAKARATREVLRNYVLFLANTGVRHGTEALGLRWRNLVWLEKDGERYLYVNVDGKTKSRAAVTRDKVARYLDRQSKINSKLTHDSFEELVAANSDELVFTTSIGEVANIYSLNRAFNALLEHLDLKTGADGKSRTLYSLRHYYTNWLLQNGVSTHLASKQLGNSTPMVDTYYSKMSALLNPDIFSGRNMPARSKQQAPTQHQSIASLAFANLNERKLDPKGLLAVLGVGTDDFVATDEIKMAAMDALQAGNINQDVLLEILAG